MSWPTDDITTTHLDAATDDPSQARAELYTVAQRVKDVIAGRGTTSGICDLDSSGYVPSSRLTSSLITTALGYTPWHSGNDGTGSGLDADLLDGAHASAFVKADGSVAMTGDLDMNSQDVDNCKTVTFVAEASNSISGGAVTINWNTAQKQALTMNASCTITFTAPLGPCNLILKLVFSGSYNPTWPATVKWPGGTEPTWSTSGTDIAAFYYDGTNYYGQAGIGFA